MDIRLRPDKDLCTARDKAFKHFFFLSLENDLTRFIQDVSRVCCKIHIAKESRFASCRKINFAPIVVTDGIVLRVQLTRY